jgi:tRNA threonylcarbamoyladenosine biosynthesis protein TsaE
VTYIVSKNLKETKKIARDFIEKLKKTSQAKAVCLKGELGSGKTTFVKFAAKSLGVKKHITSPTFVIMKGYKLKAKSYKLRRLAFSESRSPDFLQTSGLYASGFKNLIHIDAYRLKEGKELALLGWNDILKDKRNLVFIEWPENVRDIIPKNSIEIQFKIISQSQRSIKIKWPKK